MRVLIKLASLAVISLFYISCGDLLDIEEHKDIKDKDTTTNPIDTTAMASGFVASIEVSDDAGNFRTLKFGLHDKATDGEGMYAPIGTLDADLGEIELSPKPSYESFDARWVIQNTNGTLVNIYPYNRYGLGFASFYYRLAVQPTLMGVRFYEYSISWSMNDIPAPDDAVKNKDHRKFVLMDALSNGNLFSVDMKTGVGGGTASFIYKSVNRDLVTVKVLSPDMVNSWVILCDYGD